MGGHHSFFPILLGTAEDKMKRVLGAATFVLIGWVTAPLAVAAEMQSFWDLKSQQLRVLVAALRSMVTRTASELDAYCRCQAHCSCEGRSGEGIGGIRGRAFGNSP